MGLDLAVWADGVVCDYNYVFDPKCSSETLFWRKCFRRVYLFLIDEAHNLVERGREMYSAALMQRR